MTEHTLFRTTYDRKVCDIGVVHIGYGAFHRAHQAVYIDDMMEMTGDLRWGIASVNLRQSESQAFGIAAGASEGYIVNTIAPDGARDFGWCARISGLSMPHLHLNRQRIYWRLIASIW